MTTPKTPSPLARWHDAVAARNLDDIESLLADDAIFQSPAVHSPQVGKALVAKYLRAAISVLGHPTFSYTDEWIKARSAVLEFELTLGDIHINGVDLIHWNDEGRIVLFKVMVRPLKGLNTLVALMGEALKKEPQ